MASTNCSPGKVDTNIAKLNKQMKVVSSASNFNTLAATISSGIMHTAAGGSFTVSRSINFLVILLASFLMRSCWAQDNNNYSSISSLSNVGHTIQQNGRRLQSVTTNYAFTGNSQSITIPTGVAAMTVELYGAGGGSACRAIGSSICCAGGKGGKVTATIPVTTGAIYYLFIGGKGLDDNSVYGDTGRGWNGGGHAGRTRSTGGGGATDIRTGGTALGDRILVAGGGGGCSNRCVGNGGYGGSPATDGGMRTDCGDGTPYAMTCYGGGGGTMAAGGAKGCLNAEGRTACGADGSLGTGGGGSTEAWIWYDGGGGGGSGYYGGGGGSMSGGGGGSSWPDSADTEFDNGVNDGDGYAIITYNYAPTASPTSTPTANPTYSQQPTGQPTSAPSSIPSCQPSYMPSVIPSVTPSSQPSNTPSTTPTIIPSSLPSIVPSTTPSVVPSVQPSVIPSSVPSTVPSSQPSGVPSVQPSVQPSSTPTIEPSVSPSSQPSVTPTTAPSTQPSAQPSDEPSTVPSNQPTTEPSVVPSVAPSVQPTGTPSTVPSAVPSVQPSNTPTVQPSVSPTSQPSAFPSALPSVIPSNQPSSQPSIIPTVVPSVGPSSQPSTEPSTVPSVAPSCQPTNTPSMIPSTQPSSTPSSGPTHTPSAQPSSDPSAVPSMTPSTQPSSTPSSGPTHTPSAQPSSDPSAVPSMTPSAQPSSTPSSDPTHTPSAQPSSDPSAVPSMTPSVQPSPTPSSGPTHTPSAQPSSGPTVVPSASPTQPSSVPSSQPSVIPYVTPSSQPSIKPSIAPSATASVQPSSAPPGVPSALPTSQPSSMPSATPPVVPSMQPSNEPSVFPSVVPSTQPTGAPSTVRSKVVISLPFLFHAPVTVSETFDNVAVDRFEYGSGYVFTSGIEHWRLVPVGSVISYDFSGRSVANAGDMNGDGYDDLIIGVPYAARVYVLFGTRNGFVNMTEGFTVFGAKSSDLTGWSVSGAGDVNNDEIADIIIGAPLAEYTGVVYVLYGQRSANVENVHLSDIANNGRGFAMRGTASQDAFGLSVSGAGDVNGDDYDDVAIGALKQRNMNTGAAYIIFGDATRTTPFSVSSMESIDGRTYTGPRWSWFGYSVSGAGDVNGDNYTDITIGSSPRRDVIGMPVSCLLYGNQTLPPSGVISSVLTNGNGVIITGGGVIVAGVGDVNDDHLDDVLIVGDVDLSTGAGFALSLVVVLPQATMEPSQAPTVGPTMTPTSVPSVTPTVLPTLKPSMTPSRAPTQPTVIPTAAPSGPTYQPTLAPTQPTSLPSATPTAPTLTPSVSPTMVPSGSPTWKPTVAPTRQPSTVPTAEPTTVVTRRPTTVLPTIVSTRIPTADPSRYPLIVPTQQPSVFVLPDIIYKVIYIDTSGNYSSNATYTQFVVNASTAFVEITGIRQHSMFTILPQPHSVLRIKVFNKSSDILDLQAFTNIFSHTDLILTETLVSNTTRRSLRVRWTVAATDTTTVTTTIYLPRSQVVELKGVTVDELRHAHVLFGTGTEVLPTSTENSSNIKDTIGLAIALSLLLAFVLYAVYKSSRAILTLFGLMTVAVDPISWEEERRSNRTFVTFIRQDSLSSFELSSSDSGSSSNSNDSSKDYNKPNSNGNSGVESVNLFSLNTSQSQQQWVNRVVIDAHNSNNNNSSIIASDDSSDIVISSLAESDLPSLVQEDNEEEEVKSDEDTSGGRELFGVAVYYHPEVIAGLNYRGADDSRQASDDSSFISSFGSSINSCDGEHESQQTPLHQQNPSHSKHLNMPYFESACLLVESNYLHDDNDDYDDSYSPQISAYSGDNQNGINNSHTSHSEEIAVVNNNSNNNVDSDDDGSYVSFTDDYCMGLDRV